MGVDGTAVGVGEEEGTDGTGVSSDEAGTSDVSVAGVAEAGSAELEEVSSDDGATDSSSLGTGSGRSSTFETPQSGHTHVLDLSVAASS